MTPEEKYDKALEKARELISRCTDNRDRRTMIYRVEDIESIFPELRESEDEKIRKWIINDIRFNMNNEPLNNSEYKKKAEKAIDWLEKQGKIEPKFHKGEWLCENEPNNYARFIQILEIINEQGKYRISRDIHNDEDVVEFDFLKKYYHEFDINDAKSGDVLWHSDSASNGIFIFKEIRFDGKVLCYCDYDSEDHFCLGEYHTCCWSNDKYIYPATKKQRDLLFQKMKEAGWEWNAKKKKLNKINSNDKRRSYFNFKKKDREK